MPRGDVAHAAWVVATSCREFPRRDDPHRRRRSGLQCRQRASRRRRSTRTARTTSGRDNGVFAYLGAATGAIDRSRARDGAEVSATFHGRDVFATAAIALARKIDPTAIGAQVSLEGRLPWGPRPTHEGRVVHVDAFGNLITDLPRRRGRRGDRDRGAAPGRRALVRGCRVGRAARVRRLGAHDRDRRSRWPGRSHARRAARHADRAGARRHGVSMSEPEPARNRGRRSRRSPPAVTASRATTRAGSCSCRARAPGDRVRVRTGEANAARSRAPSSSRSSRRRPSRVAAPCEAFARGCGGCHWQHVARAAQLEAKQAIVAGALRSLAGLVVAPIADPCSPLHWRRRARFHVSAGKLGLYAYGSQDVVPLTSLPAARAGARCRDGARRGPHAARRRAGDPARPRAARRGRRRACVEGRRGADRQGRHRRREGRDRFVRRAAARGRARSVGGPWSFQQASTAGNAALDRARARGARPRPGRVARALRRRAATSRARSSPMAGRSPRATSTRPIEPIDPTAPPYGGADGSGAGRRPSIRAAPRLRRR